VGSLTKLILSLGRRFEPGAQHFEGQYGAQNSRHDRSHLYGLLQHLVGQYDWHFQKQPHGQSESSLMSKGKKQKKK